MKIIRFHETGGPGVLVLEENDDPKPKAGQALVRVWAAGVNPTDILARKGQTPNYYSQIGTIGRDASGVVEALGDGVTSVKLGDEVIIRTNLAGYAELAVATEEFLFPAPPNLSHIDAASVGVAFTTAWDAVVNKAQVQPGQTVLVPGAAGGAGIAGVQMAKLYGATVIGAASTPEKLAWVKEQGADHVVNYTEDDWPAQVKEMTNGDGVDAIIDGVSGSFFPRYFECIRDGAAIAIYGSAAGRDTTFHIPRLYGTYARILGSRGNFTSHEDFLKVLDLLNDGKLRATVDRTWPLGEATEAHRYMEARKVKGKIVLTVAV